MHAPASLCLQRISAGQHRVLGGAVMDVRNFLTPPRHELTTHDSCISACLVESGCSVFPYLLSVLQYEYHLGARSCLRALAFVFLFITCAGFLLGISSCALFSPPFVPLFSFVSCRCLFRHVLVRGYPCGGAAPCVARAGICSVMVVSCGILLLVALSAPASLLFRRSSVGRSPFVF